MANLGHNQKRDFYCLLELEHKPLFSQGFYILAGASPIFLFP
jgi:hypothetical protein